MPEYRTKRK